MDRFRVLPSSFVAVVCAVLLLWGFDPAAASDTKHSHEEHQHVEFTVRSVRNGNWSDKSTWQPAQVPVAGDREVEGDASVVHDERVPVARDPDGGGDRGTIPAERRQRDVPALRQGLEGGGHRWFLGGPGWT